MSMGRWAERVARLQRQAAAVNRRKHDWSKVNKGVIYCKRCGMRLVDYETVRKIGHCEPVRVL